MTELSIGMKILLFFAMASFPAWFLLFAGLQQRRESRRRNEREYTRTAGRIAGYVRRETRGGHAAWRPIVEYAAMGRTFSTEYEDAMDPEAYPPDGTVTVLYDVNEPSRFHLEEDPVFISGGAGAIRISVIWILASAALALTLAVFVGGFDPDLGHLRRRLMRLFRQRR